MSHAGLKDKHAVSTQTFSILLPEGKPEDLAKIIESGLGVTVNWADRHPKKLRSGHLKGNTFTITVTGLDDSHASALRKADDIQKAVAKLGIPNYFGTQRIGKTAGMSSTASIS
jgi:tRNA pseudouridine13 synthase